ncbi:MAG: NAD(P)-binding protein [Planctomycetota bacterium]|jgi:NADPH-dependent glutamate synthase beta subunit-like oxidoreductase
MALKRKKKKDIKLETLRSSGSSSVETSPLRPVHIEKLAPCMSGCPQHQNIRKMLVTIALAEKQERNQEDAFKEAWEILAEDNPLPSVCGRVCPHPCETECNRKEKDHPVAINAMEQFVGDYGLEKGFTLEQFKTGESHDEKIAVVGAGPAGITAAYHLARRGYKVTMFEAFPKTGGMLRYGIPPYRLPHDVLDAEVQRVLDLGVELKLNTAVGTDIPYDDVVNNFDAVFVGIGAHKGRALRLEGEDAENVLSGAEFLHRANLGEKVEIGKKVVVIGGGDTAIDAARVARRLGAEASILYRRTRTEMPAIEEEIVGAEEEGVAIDLLVAPVGIVRNNGRAEKMVFQRCELGEPDDSGRRRPVPIEGSEFEVEADTFIAAISQEPVFEGLQAVGNSKDWIKADEWMQTEDGKICAGGDVLNLGLVTIAIFQGKYAAKSIHDNLRSKEHWKAKKPKPVILADKIRIPFYEDAKRMERNHLEVEKRFADDPWVEIAKGLDAEEAINESRRCMSCGLCFECGECWSFCQDQAVIKPLKPGERYKFKMELCNGCKKCAEQCPCGYIEMHMPGEAPVYDD